MHNEKLLRELISRLIREINAIGMGGGTGVSRGTIRGVITPLGTGPAYPADAPKKKKKKKKKESDIDDIVASAFGGGSLAKNI